MYGRAEERGGRPVLVERERRGGLCAAGRGLGRLGRVVEGEGGSSSWTAGVGLGWVGPPRRPLDVAYEAAAMARWLVLDRCDVECWSGIRRAACAAEWLCALEIVRLMSCMGGDF